MAKGKTLCNVCGKEFSDYDEQEVTHGIRQTIPRGRLVQSAR